MPTHVLYVRLSLLLLSLVVIHRLLLLRTNVKAISLSSCGNACPGEVICKIYTRAGKKAEHHTTEKLDTYSLLQRNHFHTMSLPSSANKLLKGYLAPTVQHHAEQKNLKFLIYGMMKAISRQPSTFTFLSLLVRGKS